MMMKNTCLKVTNGIQNLKLGLRIICCFKMKSYNINKQDRTLFYLPALFMTPVKVLEFYSGIGATIFL